MSDDCIFCRIASGAVPAALVFEDDLTLAFLDHHPLFTGHTLLVPRQHFDTLLDVPGPLAAHLTQTAQVLSQAVKQAMAADGILLLLNNTVSQSVPHVHWHIIPRRWGDGLRGFLWPRQMYDSPETMRDVQRQIRSCLADLRRPPRPDNLPLPEHNG